MTPHFVWAEKYRPKTVDECILPDFLKNTFKDIVKKGVVPDMTLTGGAGMGKTSVARAICEELKVDYELINGSRDNGIDVIRYKISNFASTMSFSGAPKVVIVDEADYLHQQSAQPAMRGVIEEFEPNCAFILTVNDPTRIMSPILSRCPLITFKVPNEEKKKIAGQFFRKLKDILTQENVEYEDKVLAELVIKFFPDFRQTIQVLQVYSAGGKIDTGILAQTNDVNIAELIKYLHAKDFTAMRKWVAENTSGDQHRLIRKFYDNAKEFVKPEAIPELVLILAEHDFRSAWATDKELMLASTLTQIMMQVEFK